MMRRQQSSPSSFPLPLPLPLPILLLLLLGNSFAASKFEAKDHWWELGQNELAAALNVQDNWNVAKNVIMFLGDGMGITANTAARIYKGQKRGMHGEEGYMVWERFPNAALLKTYNVDKQVPDSAATATAYLCGIKANYYTLGLDPKVTLGDCETSKNEDYHAPSILQWAQEAGKHTGIVTTTRITHATPAATYAHAAHRNWECDGNLGDSGDGCRDIADQLIHFAPGKDIKVILGGGRQPLGAGDKVKDNFTCSREDGRNLVEEWMQLKKDGGHSAAYVTTAGELDAVNANKTDYLLGLFADSHMPFELDRESGPSGSPTLKDMTLTALKMLQKSEKGFFLLVEGGRIDHALHDNLPYRALEEAVAMDEAVAAALQVVDVEETMVVVTADHSHVMTINGYPDRGNDILGLTGDKSLVDGMPYTTLMFTNGPGYNYTSDDGKVKRHDPSQVNTRDKNYRSLAAVPMPPISETHGGEDVAVWAVGPMAHLFHRTHEQHYVAHVMAYSACVGPSRFKCARPPHATFRLDPALPTPPPLKLPTLPQTPLKLPTLPPSPFKFPTQSPSTVNTPFVVIAPLPPPTNNLATAPSIPKFPTLSPVLQQLLNDNEEKIVTALGTQSVANFSSNPTLAHLLGKTATLPHSM